MGSYLRRVVIFGTFHLTCMFDFYAQNIFDGSVSIQAQHIIQDGEVPS